jgi:hypothetical protein
MKNNEGIAMYKIGDIAAFETHPNTIKGVSMWDEEKQRFQFHGHVFHYKGQEIDEWNNPCEYVAEVVGYVNAQPYTPSWLERVFEMLEPLFKVLDKIAGHG